MPMGLFLFCKKVHLYLFFLDSTFKYTREVFCVCVCVCVLFFYHVIGLVLIDSQELFIQVGN